NPKSQAQIKIETASVTGRRRDSETQRKNLPLSLCVSVARDRVFGFWVWDLSQEEAICRVIGFDCVFVAESFQKRSEVWKVAIFDFKAREHAAEVGPVIPVVEQADVPSPGKRVEEITERAGTLGELEAAEAFVLNVRGVAADHVADMQLGHL